MCTGPHPYIPVPNVAKFEVIYNQEDQEVVNVFHSQTSAPMDASQLLGNIDFFIDMWNTTFKPHYHREYSLRRVRGTDLTTATGAVAERELFPPLFGGNETDSPLPNNVTVAIKWNTLMRGRSYRGRTFFPLLMDADVAGNRLTTTGLAHVSACAAGISSVFTRGVIQMVIVSYCHGKSWRTTGVATPVTTYSINEVLDSQRRRLPERGR